MTPEHNSTKELNGARLSTEDYLGYGKLMGESTNCSMQSILEKSEVNDSNYQRCHEWWEKSQEVWRNVDHGQKQSKLMDNMPSARKGPFHNTGNNCDSGISSLSSRSSCMSPMSLLSGVSSPSYKSSKGSCRSSSIVSCGILSVEEDIINSNTNCIVEECIEQISDDAEVKKMFQNIFDQSNIQGYHIDKVSSKIYQFFIIGIWHLTFYLFQL